MPYRPRCTAAWPVYTTNIRTYRRGSGTPTMYFYISAGRCTIHTVNYYTKVLYPLQVPNQLPSWYVSNKYPLGNLSKLCQSQPMTSYEFAHHYPINDESKERDVLYMFWTNRSTWPTHSINCLVNGIEARLLNKLSSEWAGLCTSSTDVAIFISWITSSDDLRAALPCLHRWVNRPTQIAIVHGADTTHSCS